jgi:EmrB/QacA subfamily drug resistance transporter
MMRTGGASEGGRLRRWAILATMLSGTILAILDSSILNISVIPIMEEFQADLQTVQWVLTSYNLTFAVFLIGLGSLGDTAGRRRLYVLGQVVFVVGSGLAAVASGPWPLIAFRAMQGLGAAALASNALALILEHFPDGERGAALGIWGAAAGLGGALGPTVGGVVAQTWGWRALFLLNLPIGLLVMGAAYALLAPDRPWRGRPFDTRGFFVLSAALLALSLALTGAPDLGGGWGKGGFVALALLLGTWFVLMERRAPKPLMDLGAILRRDVIAAHLSVFVALLIMGGGMFLSVLYAQFLTDASPATIGLLLAPCASVTVAIAPVGGWLTDKAGPRILAIAGLMTLTASVAIPAWWHPSSAASLVFWSNLLAGAGIGLATPALIRTSTEKVYWGFERSDLLVMEYLQGEPIRTARALPTEQRKVLAFLILRHFLKQIFVDNFFHADPHPGNILLLRDGVIGYLDFGTMGRLDRASRRGMQQLFDAMIAGDADEAARAVLKLGGTNAFAVDQEALQLDLERLIQLYRVQDGGRWTDQIIETARRCSIRLPKSVIPLTKGLVLVESLALELEPEVNLMQEIEAIVGEVALEGIKDKLSVEIPEILESYSTLLAELPTFLQRWLAEREGGASQANKRGWFSRRARCDALREAERHPMRA